MWKGHVLAKSHLAPALCKPLFYFLKKVNSSGISFPFFTNEKFGVLRMWPTSDEECFDDECDH